MTQWVQKQLLYCFACSLQILESTMVNGGTDVAAGTKYVVRWQGMKTSELEHRKQMPFYRAMWLQGL